MKDEIEKKTETKRYLSVEELSRKLNIPVSKVYRMTRTREIPFYKLGKYCRFMEQEIDTWIQSKRA